MGDISRLEERKQRQREAALEVSRERRARRKELRGKLRSGEADPLAMVAGRIDDYEDDIAGWRLEQMLRVIPGVGSVTMHEILEAFVASPRMKVRGLSYERREQLARIVADALRRPRLD